MTKEIGEVEKALEAVVKDSVDLTNSKEVFLKEYRDKQQALNLKIEELTNKRNILRSADPELKKLAQKIN